MPACHDYTLHFHVRLPLFQGEYNRTVVRRATPSVSRGAYLILAIVRCARCRSTCNSYARLSTLSFDMQFLCALLCSGARCHSTCIHSDVHATIRYAYYATLSSMLYSFLFKGSRLSSIYPFRLKGRTIMGFTIIQLNILRG